ncbi:MAG: hypothetical protein AAF252_10120 [Pseudomonadota bacterium]
MCGFNQQQETPTVRRIAAPESDAIQREGEVERTLRRRRSGVAADILTTPLGIPQ